MNDSANSLNNHFAIKRDHERMLQHVTAMTESSELGENQPEAFLGLILGDRCLDFWTSLAFYDLDKMLPSALMRCGSES